MSTVKANEYRHLNNSGTESNLTLSSNASVEVGNDLTLPQGNIDVTGNATISGNITANGNAALGNAATDAHTVTGTLSVSKPITATEGVIGDIKDTGGNVVVDVGSGNNATFDGDLTGNASTATTATNATNITLADESTDTECFVVYSKAATGNEPPKTGSNLKFNSSNGTLTATSFSGSGASLTSLNAGNLSSGSIPTARIADDAVTYAKIQNVSADERILGRVSGANGSIEELTQAQVKTFIGNATASQSGLASSAHIQKLDSLSTTPTLLDGHTELLYLHRYSPNPVAVAGAGSNAVYKSAHSTGEYFVPEAGWLYEVTVSFSYETDTDNTFFALSYGNDSSYSRNATVTGVHLLDNVRILDTGDKVQDGPHIGHLTLRGFVRWTSTSFTPNIYPVLSAKNTSTNNNLYVTINSSNSGSTGIFYTVKRYKNIDYTTSAGN